MPATYDETLPTAKDRTRLLLGDTNVATNPLLSDGTINALIRQHGETEGTAVAASSLASRFAQEPTMVGIDGDTYTWAHRVPAWQALALRLGAQGAASSSALSAYGRVDRTLRPEDLDDRSEYARPEEAYWPTY